MSIKKTKKTNVNKNPVNLQSALVYLLIQLSVLGVVSQDGHHILIYKGTKFEKSM